MKKYILKVFLLLTMLYVDSFFSVASTLNEEEVTHLPLVGKMSMEYLKKTSEELQKPATLEVSITPLLGGNSTADSFYLNSSEMPQVLTLDYVVNLIKLSAALSVRIDELKVDHVSQACIKVSLSFEGIKNHREKINGFDVLDLVE